MTRFADPHRCPDCRTTLSPGSQHCTVCGLDLSGDLARRLFSTLTRADEILVEMRARPVSRQSAHRHEPAMAGITATLASPASTAATDPLGQGEHGSGAMAPGGPVALRPSSVPRILLGLGATCLLVAALVFLAVTWSVMGVGARTATLVALTAILGGLTAVSARQGLRGAVEAMGLVTLGLAVLDVVGARTAGWLGDPSDASFATVLGALLVGNGLAATAGLLRTPAQGFTLGELSATAGALVGFWGISDGAWATSEVRALVATVLLGTLAAGTWTRVREGAGFRVAAIGTTVVASGAWFVQAADAVASASAEPTVAALWGRLEVWPVLAAAAVGVAAAGVRRVPVAARVAGLGASVLLVALAVTLPAYDEGRIAATLTAVVAVLLVAAATTVAPRPWAAAGLGVLVPGSVALVATAVGYVTGALEAYTSTAALAWSGTPGSRVERALGLPADRPWLLPVVTVAVLAALVAAGRLVDDLRTLPVRPVRVAAAGVLVLSGAATVLDYAVPVWVPLAGLLAAGTVAVVLGTVRDNRFPTALGAVLVAVALPLSFADEVLSTVALAVVLVLAIGVHALSLDSLVEEVSGAVGPFVLAGLAWSAGAAYGADPAWTVLVGLLLLGGVLLGRGWVDRDGSPASAVAVVEACSALAALPLAAAGLAGAATGLASTWASVYLTVGGVAASVLALVREDRRRVAWPGGLLLAAATWVRLADLGVHEPEPYTLPSALTLLAVGLVHLRRHPDAASTQQALGAGLLLALVPSLLWVLLDPTGVRAVLLGLACLALVVLGVQARWSAPLAYGAAVGLLVVLREAGPMIGDSVPRWALIGGAGMLLIGLGVTWEARLRDARRAVHYLQSLR